MKETGQYTTPQRESNTLKLSSHHFLDRCHRVPHMHPIEIDVVCIQALETGIERLHDFCAEVNKSKGDDNFAKMQSLLQILKGLLSLIEREGFINYWMNAMSFGGLHFCHLYVLD
jgi:hypothetical protein